jgi:hypothetical protein
MHNLKSTEMAYTTFQEKSGNVYYSNGSPVQYLIYCLALYPNKLVAIEKGEQSY